MWLTAQKGKGLEISGTWSLRNNVITMEMTFSNKAMQAMQGFGIQLNKNSFGMTTSQPLNIPLLNAGQTLDVALPMTCTGPVQKMDPLTNIQVELLLSHIQNPINLVFFQVAIKNSIDIFYFACIAPLHIFFSEEGNICVGHSVVACEMNLTYNLTIQKVKMAKYFKGRWRRRHS